MKNEREKIICETVLREVIAKRKKMQILDLSYPDENEREEEAVDLLAKTDKCKIVLEHTRIESYSGQIDSIHRAKKLFDPIKKQLDGKMPSPGHYELSFDIHKTKGATDTEKIQNVLINWIKKTAPILEIGSSEVAPAHYKEEKLKNVPFEVSLYRWPDEDRRFRYVACIPKYDNKKAIQTSLEKKCPKLNKAKSKETTSILLFELNDLSLGNHITVRKALSQINGRSDIPDDIYLVRTELDKWWIYILKEGEDVFYNTIGPSSYIIDAPKEYLNSI